MLTYKPLTNNAVQEGVMKILTKYTKVKIAKLKQNVTEYK
jgi:hypothetical protein